MIRIDIIEKAKLPYNKDILADYAKDYISRLIPNKDIFLEIIVASKNDMRKLNTQYRHKNIIADILSFPIWKNKKEIIQSNMTINLGTIFLNSNDILSDIDKSQENIAHCIDHLMGKHHR